MNWDRSYDRFLGLSAWANVLLYAAPSGALLAACWYFGVPERFWTPFLVIYFVGAVAHLLGFGFMALAVQIKTSVDYATSELDKSLKTRIQISN